MRVWPVLAMVALSACEPDAPDFMKTCTEGDNPKRNYFNYSEASCRCVYEKLKEHGLSDKQINLYSNVFQSNRYSSASPAYETQQKINNFVAQNRILSNCNQ